MKAINPILEFKNLSQTAKLVLLFLFNQRENRQPFPTQKSIQIKLNLSKITVQNAIKELTEQEFVADKQLLQIPAINNQFISTVDLSNFSKWGGGSATWSQLPYINIPEEFFSNDLSVAEKIILIALAFQSKKCKVITSSLIAQNYGFDDSYIRKTISKLKDKGYLSVNSIIRVGYTDLLVDWTGKLNNEIILSTADELINIEMEEIMNEIQLAEMIELMRKDLAESEETINLKEIIEAEKQKTGFAKQMEKFQAEEIVEERNKNLKKIGSLFIDINKEPTVEILSELAAMC